MFVYSPISKCSILTVGLLSAGLLCGCPQDSKDCVDVKKNASDSKALDRCFKCVAKYVKSPEQQSKSSSSPMTKSEEASDQGVTVQVDQVKPQLLDVLHKYPAIAKSVFKCPEKEKTGEKNEGAATNKATVDAACVQGVFTFLDGVPGFKMSKDNKSIIVDLEALEKGVDAKIEDKIAALDKSKKAPAEGGATKEQYKELEKISTDFFKVLAGNTDDKHDGQEKPKFDAALKKCGAGDTDDSDGKLFGKYMQSDWMCIKPTSDRKPTDPFKCCDPYRMSFRDCIYYV